MLRILHLEDSKEDAMLIEHDVKSEGINATFKVVKTRQDFISELEKEQFDVVLADSSTADFDGISALKMVRQKFPAMPFICLSGQQEPAHIKECYDAGATNYISKNDLSPLITTLRREAERVGN
jgi:two-component system sensor kinase